MKPLPVRPLPIPTEPLIDYLERLANANGYNLRDFLSLLNGTGSLGEGTLTTALNGYAMSEFSGPADNRFQIPVNTFGLQPIDFTHMHRRWCPSCVALGRWMRPIWRLKIATICNTHRTRLIQSCQACGAYPDLQTILQGVCTCGYHFGEVASQATHMELQLSRALEESLTRTTTLDLGGTDVHFNTQQLSRFILYTGRLIKGPSLRRPGKIRELEAVSVATGLVVGSAKLLADWPSAFWHCLEGFVEAAPADASIRRVFGALYNVLYRDLSDPIFQFLRDAFEQFLLEHWRGELCGRHRLFSLHTIQEHRYQGVARVARSAGIGSKTLRRMVHQDRFPANHFQHSSARHLITVDKETLERLLPDPNEYVDLRSTARLFGLKRSRLRELVAHGALLADAKPNFARSNHWHFRRCELTGLLAEIRQGSVGIVDGVGSVTLNHALRYWRISGMELGKLIRAVKQQEIEHDLPLTYRLSEMKFREDGLRTWLRQTRETATSWVSVARAAELLCLKEQVVYELVSRNFLVAEVISRNGHAVRRLALQSLQDFENTFIALSQLAKHRKTSAKSLMRVLEARPVTGPGVDGGRQYFFKRADLAASDRRAFTLL